MKTILAFSLVLAADKAQASNVLTLPNIHWDAATFVLGGMALLCIILVVLSYIFDKRDDYDG